MVGPTSLRLRTAAVGLSQGAAVPMLLWHRGLVSLSLQAIARAGRRPKEGGGGGGRLSASLRGPLEAQAVGGCRSRIPSSHCTMGRVSGFTMKPDPEPRKDVPQGTPRTGGEHE